MTKMSEKYRITGGCVMDFAKCIGDVPFRILFLFIEEYEPCLRTQYTKIPPIYCTVANPLSNNLLKRM